MRDRPSNPSSSELSRAAQYLRMSTEHQQYSILNQSAAIALYAAAHNFASFDLLLTREKVGRASRGVRDCRSFCV
jgi:DNA invertase Pin-like site-specific DNA recombinase